MDFLFNIFLITLCYVEYGMDFILSDLLITLCYVELGMDLLFSCLVYVGFMYMLVSCLVSCLCCVLNRVLGS